MGNTDLRTFATALLGLALLGCSPPATSETVEEGQKGSPAPGSYQDAVPVNITTLDDGDVDLAAGARAANAFGWDLHQRLIAKRKGQNLIWSPYSVASALGMGLAGAKGDTATEMQKVLHAPKGGAEALAKALGVHQRLLNQRAGADNTLRVANAIWTSPDSKFAPNYILNVGAAYGGGFHRIDFAGDPEKARGVINGWVGEQTNAMIPELIPAGVITDITKAILCNALYFQGTWAHQFEETKTKPRNFWVTKEQAKPVATMSRTSAIRLAKVEGATVGAMAYEGGTLSMVVVLPEARDGLAAIEQKLDSATLDQWIADALAAREQKKIPVYLPKWKAKVDSSLKPELEALGMKTAFDREKADFTGMLTAPKQGIYVTHVLHQAIIEVSEEGTEAAAATAMSFGVKSARPKQTTNFVVDRPFLYAIVEHDTKAILFLGRCADPSKE